MKKQTFPDPSDPTKSITVNVPIEKEYKPNKKRGSKLQNLKKKFYGLLKKERKLKNKYKAASSKRVDWPVLEDGAPAPPDAQQFKMANDLYGELAAVHFPRAKSITHDVLTTASETSGNLGHTRQALWDRFDDLKSSPLIPENAWRSTM